MTPPRPFGVVFDIDGVLLKGETLIPGAREAVEQVGGGGGRRAPGGGAASAPLLFYFFGSQPTAPLSSLPLSPSLSTLSHHHQVRTSGAPYVFVTNQGWLDEPDRAALLSQQLALPVSPDQVVLAHSALREEVAAIGAGLVLVTGRCRSDAAAIVRGYGFPTVHTIAEYAAAHPHLHPLKHAGGNGAGRPASADAATPAWALQPVAAVFVIETPEDWHEDLQVIVDLVRSRGGRPGDCAGGRQGAAADGAAGPAAASPPAQAVRLVVCNFDFVFAAEHGVPRFGPGAFFAALEALHARATAPANGGVPAPLHVVRHGKPHPPAYVAALRKLRLQQQQQQAAGDSQPTTTPPPLTHVYALGDNPASDVRGANAAGGPWRSVLVRTGVWAGTDPATGDRADNDGDDPAHFVCESAADAVAMIMRANGVGGDGVEAEEAGRQVAGAR
jgi:HAD superfamily hydrolase (TIGR01456 family)